jgi:hypothetical protein
MVGKWEVWRAAQVWGGAPNHHLWMPQVSILSKEPASADGFFQRTTKLFLGRPGTASTARCILSKMPHGLVRYQKTGNFHFLTFSCYHRLLYLNTAEACGLFECALE